jgi:hypothetical protein
LRGSIRLGDYQHETLIGAFRKPNAQPECIDPLEGTVLKSKSHTRKVVVSVNSGRWSLGDIAATLLAGIRVLVH